MNFHDKVLHEEMFLRALTLELVEDGDEISLEDLTDLLVDFGEQF